MFTFLWFHPFFFLFISAANDFGVPGGSNVCVTNGHLAESGKKAI
jgi:hypothetical protein